MKIKIFIILMIGFFGILSSCRSAKCGCGLTSDAEIIKSDLPDHHYKNYDAITYEKSSLK